MDPTGQRVTNPDIFDRMWSRPGKALKNPIRDIVYHMGPDTTLETIWAMVELSDISDEGDRIRTFQALSDIRLEMRKVAIKVLAAIS
jgi:hypothetical protein